LCSGATSGRVGMSKVSPASAPSASLTSFARHLPRKRGRNRSSSGSIPDFVFVVIPHGSQ
jgi:hypothetical protein